jgi:2-keto-4-pentenoate hydratase/2-oxohepta-3-ene-1,7-dioic acid hydratase in catechol pathway
MRIVNHGGRAGLLLGELVLDIEEATAGRFSSDPQTLYGRWDELREWAATAEARSSAGVPVSAPLASPVPRPRQVFAIGLNYRDHAAEAARPEPETPMVFTKFPSCIAGPHDTIALPPGSVDFEAELAVVIGRRAEHVPAESAWEFVAGLTVGQDISERELQTSPPHPSQYGLAKSYPGFGPLGPAVVSLDELADRGSLGISCTLNGETMQEARTDDMIFDVPAIVAYLSGVLPLLPGDVIFTGTPAGIGYARTPRRLLQPGDELVTQIEGLGAMRHHFAAASAGSGGVKAG